MCDTTVITLNRGNIFKKRIRYLPQNLKGIKYLPQNLKEVNTRNKKTDYPTENISHITNFSVLMRRVLLSTRLGMRKVIFFH